MFTKDIGIDLGTASVLVYVRGKGIVLKEPSVVAVNTDTGAIKAVGKPAQTMLGRTPENIMAIRPLRDGVISRYDVTMVMIREFLRRALGNTLLKPRVIICIPSGITEVEARAVLDAAKQAGASRVHLIEEPVAAAIGAGIDINRANGNMVVDIGGGTTDIAVISLGGVVVSDSVKIAGDKFDDAIIRYMRQQHNILIGERTAEAIKIRIGAVYSHPEQQFMQVKGRCLIQGLPRVVNIGSYEIMHALTPPISEVIDAICDVIERTPPGLIGDIMNNGIVMTGGGSLLYGFDRLIEHVTNIPTRVAPKAVSCVAMGTGIALESYDLFSENEIYVTAVRSPRQAQ